MTILVILGHPQPGSFNHAIADATCTTLAHNGYQVIRHDLYAEQFDPLLSSTEIGRDAPLPAHIEQHCADLVAAEGIIMIHPNWWGQPPAILKGWVDRVIRPGVAYRFCEGDAGDG
ncbi:MAG: NAD(P)H-dependent oxidoreductase, partial [Oscillochloris sp.]|nr:NAD(P)H-dependent oxidoreductase [Oscillochloris sp.]